MVTDLRRTSVFHYVFLDEWLVTGMLRQEAQFNVVRTVELLDRLCWVINRGKLRLTPDQEIIFLGTSLEFRTG